MSKLRRPSPGNFSEDLDKLLEQLDQPRSTRSALAKTVVKYLPRRAARSPTLHNRLLFGEVGRGHAGD